MNKTKLINPYTKEEIENHLSKKLVFSNHPKNIYDKIGIIINEGIDFKELSGEKKETVQKGILLKAFKENHFLLDEAFVGSYLTTVAIDFTESLIEEYKCKSSLEKTLCEIIALNYVKIMQLSNDFQNMFNKKNINTKILDILGKQIDRANRMYLLNLNNLLEIKRPKTSININTKNAYLGNNQQINNKNEIGKKN